MVMQKAPLPDLPRSEVEQSRTATAPRKWYRQRKWQITLAVVVSLLVLIIGLSAGLTHRGGSSGSNCTSRCTDDAECQAMNVYYSCNRGIDGCYTCWAVGRAVDLLASGRAFNSPCFQPESNSL